MLTHLLWQKHQATNGVLQLSSVQKPIYSSKTDIVLNINSCGYALSYHYRARWNEIEVVANHVVDGYEKVIAGSFHWPLMEVTKKSLSYQVVASQKSGRHGELATTKIEPWHYYHTFFFSIFLHVFDFFQQKKKSFYKWHKYKFQDAVKITLFAVKSTKRNFERSPSEENFILYCWGEFWNF